MKKRQFLMVVLSAGLILLFITALPVSSQEDCVGLPECYEPTPVPPEDAPPPPEPEETFTCDGRLNCDPGEYYTVYCQRNHLEILRVVPQIELITTVPLADIAGLDVGAALDIGNFMTIVRNTEDTITIYGSNGNRAPEPGEKAFSLNECIESNGGLPEPPPPTNNDDDETDNTLNCRDLDTFLTYLDLCAYEAGFNDLGVFLITLFVFCMGNFAPFGVVLVGIPWTLRYIVRRGRK